MINRYDIVKNIEELGEQILKELAPNEFRLFAERTKLYVDNAFDEYHVKHNLSAMESLFAGYVNARLDTYLKILKD